MDRHNEIEYQVKVTGLEEAQASAENAGESANQAEQALSNARAQGSSTLPTLLMSVRSLNATRLAVQQTSKAITELNPNAALYGFLNMVQVVRNLTTLTGMLKESTGAASAAQAVLATLTGRWWLIPIALAAGALVYSRIKSMQTGGTVPDTGLYLLHRGEEVVPRNIIEKRSTSHRHLYSYGPIFVTFQSPQNKRATVDELLRELGPRIVEQVRRGG